MSYVSIAEQSFLEAATGHVQYTEEPCVGGWKISVGWLLLINLLGLSGFIAKLADAKP